MIVDGKTIAAQILSDLKAEIADLGHVPCLCALTCAPQFETQKFLSIKKRKAEEIGINVVVREFPEHSTTDEILSAIQIVKTECDGIVLQLPFPKRVDVDRLLKAIPSSHDVDAFLLRDEEVLPPVVGAFHEVLKAVHISPEGASVVVVGNGRLVGQPAAEWFTKKGARVTTVIKETADISQYTRHADILVLGAGVPGLLTPGLINEGVVILDAGTSEEGGELRGDADPRCAEKASVFTPVPGGIGPITVAILLRNLVTLTRRNLKNML